MIENEMKRIYTTIMRGGTSKGIFLKENDLPQDPALRDKAILSIFGSPDPRQIDGLGGAEILTSKLAIIGPPSRSDADVDFTFGQVEVNEPVIHYDGLCGNISSAVGPYAIEEGFVKAVEPVTKVRVHSKNTHQIFIAEVPVLDGKPEINGDYQLDGVPGTGAKIEIDMVGTVGSRTGKLLPTGNPIDKIKIDGFGEIEVTMVDVANPCIFVRAVDINLRGDEIPNELDNNKSALDLIQKIRTKCSEIMGLRDWNLSQPIPFLAFVSPAKDYQNYLTNEIIKASDVDFLTRMVLLGKMHKTYAGSVSCATGIAAVIKGSIVNETAKIKESRKVVYFGHPGGIIDVGAEVAEAKTGVAAKRITYGRTARRLMDGYAYIPNYKLEK
jgi:2-methylaconitate cis-trans-isomerase PrpF